LQGQRLERPGRDDLVAFQSTQQRNVDHAGRLESGLSLILLDGRARSRAAHSVDWAGVETPALQRALHMAYEIVGTGRDRHARSQPDWLRDRYLTLGCDTVARWSLHDRLGWRRYRLGFGFRQGVGFRRLRRRD